MDTFELKFPEKAKEWDAEKNDDLKASTVPTYSKRKVWWLCNQGHSWQATIKSRAHGAGCPYCAGKRPIIGLTDLKSCFPTLSMEWDDENNHGLTPDMVTTHSNKKVWWKCNSGHRWKTSVNERTRGTGCPFCAGARPIVGLNDLGTVRPDIAKEWDYTQNGELTPQMVLKSSAKKVSWICSKGHTWVQSVHCRVVGTGCPYCNGRRVLSGVNDLETMYPHLCTEWDYKENGDLLPHMVKGNSSKSVAWVCQFGHRWKARINHRVNNHNCPYCAGNYPVPGTNDLATLRHDLVSEWDHEKNGAFTPQMAKLYTQRAVYWKCSKGHTWKQPVCQRAKARGCPYCNGLLPIPGETDLATRFPHVAAEWHPVLNGGLSPSQVLPYSDKKIWWRCSQGHEWEATSGNRTIHLSGCPFCLGRYPIIGANDLASVHPDIATEWDYEHNGNLTPGMVTAGSGKRVYWKCSKGHIWKACIADRSFGYGCPYCSGRKRNRGFNDFATINPRVSNEWNDECSDNLRPESIGANSHKKI